MAQKNIRLDVAISKLALTPSSNNPVTLSLFLSFAKKSSQAEKPFKPNQNGSIIIDHTLTINYQELDLSKNKYCLLFIYEISKTGRKRVVGNTPINILQANRQGLHTLSLEECKQDATVQLSVQLDFEDREDEISSKASSLQKYACLSLIGKDKKNNLRYSQTSAKLQELSRLKSPDSVTHLERVPASKFSFKSPKRQMNGVTTSMEFSPVGILSTNATGKVDNLVEDIQIPAQIRNGRLQSKQRLEGKDQDRQQLVSYTSLEYNSASKINESFQQPSTAKPGHLQINKMHTFGAIDEYPIPTKRITICPINIFDYIPPSRSSRLRIKKTIAIKYIPFRSDQCAQDLHTCDDPLLSPRSTPGVMTHVNENSTNKYMIALQEECRLLADANQQLTAEFITIKQALQEYEEEAEGKIEEYENALNQLREEINYVQAVNSQYEQAFEQSKQRISEADAMIENLFQENAFLKQALAEKTNIIHRLKAQVQQEDQKKIGIMSNQASRSRQDSIYLSPSHSDIIIESHPEGKDSRVSFERNSEKVFESFYDAKRTYIPNQNSSVISKPGRIVSNRPNMELSRGSSSIPNSFGSNETGNTGNNSMKGNYSQVVGKGEYERVTTKKGYFIDHLENERKQNSVAQSQMISQKPQELEPKPTNRAEKPKVKTFFFNNKYIKDKKNKGQPSK